MKSARIQSLVDRLLAHDERYSPLALLRLVGRIREDELQRWERGELGVLEDGLAGNVDGSIILLRLAADWARKLGLAAEVEPPDRPCFRNPQHDRMARTVWRRRVEESAQGNLFFDNRFSVARSGLVRSLVDADAAAAEQHLADMARAQPGNDQQADGEHLVGALSWLDAVPAEVGAVIEALEHDIAPRARRFLGHADGERFLARFWLPLLGKLDPAAYDADHPNHHPSALLERLGDAAAVIDAVLAVPDHVHHPDLLERLARAGLASGERDQGIRALCQLCWRFPARAETWLESCQDEELTRRTEQFWDLDSPLPIDLFPAWLVSVAYPVPEFENKTLPVTPSAKAMAQIRLLRQDPTSLALREWFQLEQPKLLAVWLARD